MGIAQHAMRYGQRRMTRKMLRAVPWLGALVAIATLGSAVRRKGMVGGTLHTALDFTPVVGTAKNLAEMFRGRDFISDKGYTAAPR
jgi:hypothetical protein